MNRSLSLICGIALAMAVDGVAHSRDLEMGGDSPYRYSIAAPDSNVANHHAAAGLSRKRRTTSRQLAKPLWRGDYDKK